MRTIYSLVTKPINQNVSIIRISGPDTFNLTRKLFSPIISNKKNTAVFRKLFWRNKFIDNVIILSFEKPNSFTGENLIEIQSHGNMFIVKKILSILDELGIEKATPGEFSKQAFMNNKIDLSQANAINSLILSETEFMTKAAQSNLNNSQTKNIDSFINELTEIISKIKVLIDYPENYDLDGYTNEEIIKKMELISMNLEEDIYLSRTLIKIENGIRLSIIGIPNAGKSTLLNKLVNSDKAIVTNVEGTTRDIVESTILINDVKVTLQDTAGIRNSKNVIEKIGIEKSIEAAKSSEILIFLLDGTKDIIEQELYLKELIKREDYIKVINKMDQNKNSDNDDIKISAINNNVLSLIRFLEEYISTKFNLEKISNASLINQNQIDAYEKVYSLILKSIDLLKNNETTDIIILELEEAAKILGSMVGKVIDNDYITDLFRNFCIGK